MAIGATRAPGRGAWSSGEKQHTMSKRESDWYVPADWLWHFGSLVIIPCVALLASMLLPVVARLKTADVARLYACGVGAGALGVLLLFIALLPLYRVRRFWTLGPRQLDRRHRRYYWQGYIAVTVSLLLLWMVRLRAS